jgi:general secretion pathway protein D
MVDASTLPVARPEQASRLLRVLTVPVLAIGALLAVLMPLPAQNPPQPSGQQPQGQGPTMQDQGDVVTLSFNETNGMELLEFIKYTERITHKRFVWALDNELTTGGIPPRITYVGTITFHKPQFVTEFYAFFQTMLYIKGFALVPRGEGNLELLEIVQMAGPRAKEIQNGARYVTPEELGQYRNQTGVPILTMMPLKHINAPVAVNALRPFYGAAGAPSSTLQFGNVGNNTALLLQGFGPQVYSATELLKLVDQPVEVQQLIIYVARLENAAAEELEPLLNDILNDAARIRSQAAAQAGAAGGQGQPAVDPNANKLKIQVIPSLRALILSGTPDMVNEAKELIARIDVRPDALDDTVSVYRLKNVLAKELQTTLQQFITDDTNAERQAQQGTPGGAAAPRQARRTVIRNHDESNSLIISASQTKYQQIIHLIDQLDRRQPQVLIEVALVELTTGDLTRFGIELGLLDAGSSGKQGFGFTSFGISTFQDNNGDGLPDTRLPDFTNPLQGVTGGIISNSDFAMPVLLNALASDSRANILSAPSVLVNNNEAAVVTTEEERPTTQVNQGTATSTTGNGAPRHAGITLQISPTISPNNYLRLNINLEVSRFVGSFDPASASGGGVILRRSIRTQVTMPSEDTMVLGGVIEDQESTVDSGVPFLKDIPILGWLFKTYNREDNKTNLYFFVTPTILDEPDFQDLWQVSLAKKMQAEQYIGTRRLQLVDPKWTGSHGPAQPRTLEDKGATHENVDSQGNFETPFYMRPGAEEGTRKPNLSGPSQPGGNGKGS